MRCDAGNEQHPTVLPAFVLNIGKESNRDVKDIPFGDESSLLVLNEYASGRFETNLFHLQPGDDFQACVMPLRFH